MISKRVFFLACLVFVVESNLLSQNSNLNNIDKYLNQLSPQAYEFIKYGNTDVSYFTGEAKVKIPIYTYKDKDFEIPIFLGYDASGFIPNKREGIVGLNWFLNAGGVITRKVNGMPDDRGGNVDLDQTSLHGLYYGISKNKAIKSKSKSDIFNFTAGGVVNANECWNIDGCEVNPDEFDFSMPGCSGTFFIENNGEVRCSGNLPYKVDLSGLGIQEFGATELNPSTIIITTDNGYKYYFGGDIQYLEVSIPLNSSGTLINGVETAGVINAWHLNKIVAPNGRQVTYSYKLFTEGFGLHGGTVPEDEYHYLLNFYNAEYLDMASSTVKLCTIFGCQTFASYEGGGGFQDIYEATKTVYLEKIQIDKTSINFSYKEKEKTFYSSETTPLNQKTLELDAITINYDGVSEAIKTYSFDLGYIGGSYSDRLFLKSFQELGQRPYVFDYYKTDQIPDPKTHGIDYWGFWNGGYENDSKLIPTMTWATESEFYNGNFTYSSSEREPDATKCDVGLLEKITYPTGGTTSFYYQGHTYTKRLERRNDSAFLPALYSVDGIAGGTRIWKVVDNDGSNNQLEKEYKYVKDNPDGTTSSGTLLDWPRYVYAWKYTNNGTTQTIIKEKSTSFNTNYYPGEKYIQYSEVFEVLKPNNGYTHYKFTNHETNPNVNDNSTSVIDADYNSNVTNRDLYNNYIGLTYNSTSFERGIPYEITQYANINGEYKPVKKKTVDVFTQQTDYPNNYIVGVFQSGALAESFKIYYYPFLTKKETETNYSNDGTVTTVSTNESSYNSSNQLIRSKFDQSDGSSLINKWKYISDLVPNDYCATQKASCRDQAIQLYNQCISSNPDHSTDCLELRDENFENCDAEYNTCIQNYPEDYLLYSSMNSKNMISGLVEEQSLRKSGNVIEQTSGNIYLYKDFGNNFYLPYCEKRLFLSNPSTDTTQVYFNNSGSLVYNGNYVSVANVDSYDSYGNLLQYYDYTSKMYNSYLWDSDKRYPISEVKNAKYNEIYFQGFESTPEINAGVPYSIDNSFSRSGKASFKTEKPDAGEYYYFTPYLNINNSTDKKYRYSCWVYSNGPTVQLYLFMKPNTDTDPYSSYQAFDVSTAKTNKWVYLEGEVTVPSTMKQIYLRIDNNGGGTVWFDDLRLCPSDAQMMTYTYDPMFGMTSKTDENAITTFYTYDTFGRLEVVMDGNGNLLKKYKYHFKGEE